MPPPISIGRAGSYAALATAVIAVSFSAIFITLADAPALAIAAHRMLFAVLLLAPPTLLTRWSELRAMSRSDLAALVASGCFLAAHFGLWTLSLDYTSVASSVIFVSTHPIFVALAEALLLGQRIGGLARLGIVLTVAGSLVIGIEDLRLDPEALFGDALALGGALTFVGYLLIGRRLRQRLSLLSYSLSVYSFCWFVLALTTMAVGVPLGPLSMRDLSLFFALAAVSTIGGHTVFNWTLRHLPASVVAAALVGEAVGAAALAWLILGQIPAGLTVIGGGIILLGIYLAARNT